MKLKLLGAGLYSEGDVMVVVVVVVVGGGEVFAGSILLGLALFGSLGNF